MQPLVLVVEDEPLVADVTCRMVEAAGYRCERVGTGREATALLDTEALAVDLVILDIVLPDMLGTQVAEFIRQRQPGTRILFTSAYLDHQEEPPQILGSGFLPKPYSGEELAAALQRLWSTEGARQARLQRGP